MKFLVLYVLHDESRLYDILDAWSEAGVGGITVLASTGVGRISKIAALREDMPIIPTLSDLLQNHEELLNRTLFSIVDGQELVDKIVEATEKVVGKLIDHNTGILAVLPVAQVYGLRQRSDEVSGG